MIKGSYGGIAPEFVTVQAESPSGEAQFPCQTWPVADSRFKILALLSPGPNHLAIRSGGSSEAGRSDYMYELNLTYIPLLQSPPLHLAIMVGKDSPLLIDCPPAKYGGVSSAHASLEAAIAKFRMTAYMWQALTAEDMRAKGLGRRSFRLEEEWSADTTSSTFLNASHAAALFAGGAMRATAKIHLIPSERTVQEIRDTNVAQQNNQGGGRRRDSLHAWFSDAIKAYGKTNPSFASSARPVVAGLILDAHYSPTHDMIVGHAALGAHNPTGLSLGVMGSHLTYSWPRFLEEVTSCLLDTRSPGDMVGNDNGECGTLWEACAIGQGAFLHEVGHAFGAPHTTGIMARGYAVHWPRNFVAKTAWCEKDNEDGAVVVEDDNEARWDLKDALGFSFLPHFWMPGDDRGKMGPEASTAAPAIAVRVDAANLASEDAVRLEISSPAGLARVQWNGQTEPAPSIPNPVPSLFLSEKDLEARFPREEPLHLSVLGRNGKDRTVRDVWRLLASKSFVRIPGTDLVLNKRSVMAKFLEEGDDQQMEGKTFWTWATMLQKRKEDGTLARACKVDVRTGMVLDGAYVYYDDFSRVNCGPRVGRYKYGGKKHKHTFGGHASQAVDIPQGQDIAKVEVSREGHILRGIRLTLRDGTAGGRLSGGGQAPETLTLGKSWFWIFVVDRIC